MSSDTSCIACAAPVGPDDRPALDCTTQDGRVVRYSRCASCGLYVLDPFPFREQIATFYPESYYGLGETKFVPGVEHLREWFSAGRVRSVCRALSARHPKVLDVGCGNGSFLKGMERRGCEIYGTEMEGPAAERAGRIDNIHLHRGELSEQTFPGEIFNAVSMWHVLEHVPEPYEILRQCADLTSDGGYLFVEVPRADSLQARCSGGHWLHLDPPRHLYQFSEHALTSLIRRSGFDIQSVQRGSLEMGAIGVLQSWLNMIIRPRDLLYEMLRTRNRCAGTPLAKTASLALAAVLGLPALLFSLVEIATGGGAVLRVVATKSARSADPSGSSTAGPSA